MFLSSSILNHPVSKTKTNTVEVKFSTILLSFSLNWLSLLQYLALPSSSPPSVWLLWTEPQVGLHWRSEWDRQISAFLGTFYLNLGRFVRSCSPQHCLSLNLLPVWSHSWPGRLQGSLLLSRKKHSNILPWTKQNAQAKKIWFWSAQNKKIQKCVLTGFLTPDPTTINLNNKGLNESSLL